MASTDTRSVALPAVPRVETVVYGLVGAVVGVMAYYGTTAGFWAVVATLAGVVFLRRYGEATQTTLATSFLFLGGLVLGYVVYTGAVGLTPVVLACGLAAAAAARLA